MGGGQGGQGWETGSRSVGLPAGWVPLTRLGSGWGWADGDLGLGEWIEALLPGGGQPHFRPSAGALTSWQAGRGLGAHGSPWPARDSGASADKTDKAQGRPRPCSPHSAAGFPDIVLLLRGPAQGLCRAGQSLPWSAVRDGHSAECSSAHVGLVLPPGVLLMRVFSQRTEEAVSCGFREWHPKGAGLSPVWEGTWVTGLGRRQPISPQSASLTDLGGRWDLKLSKKLSFSSHCRSPILPSPIGVGLRRRPRLSVTFSAFTCGNVSLGNSVPAPHGSSARVRGGRRGPAAGPASRLCGPGRELGRRE